MNLDLLSMASVQVALAVIVVWIVSRLFPKMSPVWRCWLWRLVGLKCIAALYLAPVLLPIPRAAVPAPMVYMTANAKNAPIRDVFPASLDVPPSAYRSPPPVQNWRNNRYVFANDAMLALSALWWIGFAAVLSRLLLAARKVRIVLRSSFPDPLASAALARVQHQAGFLSAVRIRVSPGLGAPAVVGLSRPTILLPEIKPNEPSEALDSAIAHELAHVKRGDLKWVVAGEFCRAIFWFHPLVWLACKEQHAESEIAADQLARKWSQCSPREYGLRLLAWLDRPTTLIQSPALLLSTHELSRRLQAMSRSTYKKPVSIAIGTTASIPLALAMIPMRLDPGSPGSTPRNEVVISSRTTPQRILIPPMKNHRLDASDRAKDELESLLRKTARAGIENIATRGTGGKVYSAPLGGGGKVELLGLTHIEPKKTCSWSADGTPLKTILPVVPTVEINVISFHETGKDGKDHVVEDTGLAFQRQALLRISRGYQGANGQFVVPGNRREMRYSFSNTMPISGTTSGNRLVTIQQSFPNDVKVADLIVSYFRPLKSLGKSLVKDGEVIPGVGAPDAKIVPIEKMGRILPAGQRDFRPKKDALVLSVAKPENGLDQMRAVIYKKDGHNVWGPNLWSRDMKEQPDADSRCYWLIENVKMSDIAEIRFAVTRYERVVFKNVQLHPRG